MAHYKRYYKINFITNYQDFKTNLDFFQTKIVL